MTLLRSREPLKLSEHGINFVWKITLEAAQRESWGEEAETGEGKWHRRVGRSESGPGSGLTWAGMETAFRASKPRRNSNEGIRRK